MSDTGFISPGSVDGVYAFGNDWTYPDAVKVIGGSPQYAHWAGSKFDPSEPGDGPELRCTNFGFNIPAGATIRGIETKIYGHTDGNQVSELAYVTTDGTSVSGAYKRNDWTTLTTTDTTHTYGSPTDLWGGTLTPADVNASTFGWIFMIYDDSFPLNMRVDYMQMNVYYTLPSAIIVMMSA